MRPFCSRVQGTYQNASKPRQQLSGEGKRQNPDGVLKPLLACAPALEKLQSGFLHSHTSTTLTTLLTPDVWGLSSTEQLPEIPAGYPTISLPMTLSPRRQRQAPVGSIPLLQMLITTSRSPGYLQLLSNLASNQRFRDAILGGTDLSAWLTEHGETLNYAYQFIKGHDKGRAR